MSWTLLVFGEPPPQSKALDDWQPPSMGSPTEVRERIDTSLSAGVVWSTDGSGQYGDDSCLLAFRVGGEDPVFCVPVDVRGLGVVQTLFGLARKILGT